MKGQPPFHFSTFLLFYLFTFSYAYSQKPIIGKPIARFGSIRVNSDPPGAEIYVDGIAKGFTPQAISHLMSGSYCVVIHKEDYIDVIRTTEVSAGTITEINVKLKSIIRQGMVYPLKGIMVTAERIKPIPVFGNIAFISEKERYEQTMDLSCGIPQSYGGAFTSTGPIGIMNYWTALSGYKGNMGRDYSDYNKLNLFGKFMVPVDETTKLRLLLEILQMEQHLPGTLTKEEIKKMGWQKAGEDSALNSYKTWWASTIYEKNMGEDNKLSMRFFHYTKQYINKIHQSDQSAPVCKCRAGLPTTCRLSANGKSRFFETRKRNKL